MGALPTEAGSRTREELEAALRDSEERLRSLSQTLEQANRRLRRANTALRKLATTDPLTGVGNRRELDERLQLELRRASRSLEPLSLLFLDVDHFKKYNDRFGHEAGDAVLARLATLLQQTVRSSDTVARFGGEEFVILLPDTDEEGARTLAEKLRETVAHRLPGAVPVTASLGAATCRPPTGRSADFRMQARRLLASADRAVYEAKHVGRNRVVHRVDLEAAEPGQGG